MKVRELYEKLGRLMESPNGCADLPIVIALDDPAVGPSAFADIKGLFPGFDWDAGKVLINADRQIVTKNDLKPRLFKDGNKWCALYGDNIQEGIVGFGNTPKEAHDAFVKECLKP